MLTITNLYFYFIIAATLYLGFWAFKWSHNGWYNIILKLSMTVLTIWGAYGLYISNITNYYAIALTAYFLWFSIIWSSDKIWNKLFKTINSAFFMVALAFTFVYRMFG
jgi:hypothetical protein